jgi:uncharacterized protein with LGFP repeats
MSRGKHGWTLLSVLVVLVSLVPLTLAVPAAAAPDTANIYLIAIGDNGMSGPAVGCGDSLIPVQVDIGSPTTTEARITAALNKLFAIHTANYGESGLYDALYQASLSIDSVRLDGSRAIVRLSGTFNLRGECDDPRVIGQIKSTILQFPGISRADVVYQGDLIDAGFLGAPHPTWHYFTETDHLVSNGFWAYWQKYGGLATFGYPITEEMQENGVTVQYFERARFEWHPGAAPTRYDVLLGLLGNFIAAGRMNEAPFTPIQAGSDANCTFYAPTGHRLCFGFRDYWTAHGGLAIFGYPISEEFTENGYTVQYFERQRLEYHPNNAPAWQVEGGLLGVQVYQAIH